MFTQTSHQKLRRTLTERIHVVNKIICNFENVSAYAAFKTFWQENYSLRVQEENKPLLDSDAERQTRGKWGCGRREARTPLRPCRCPAALTAQGTGWTLLPSPAGSREQSPRGLKQEPSPTVSRGLPDCLPCAPSTCLASCPHLSPAPARSLAYAPRPAVPSLVCIFQVGPGLGHRDRMVSDATPSRPMKGQVSGGPLPLPLRPADGRTAGRGLGTQRRAGRPQGPRCAWKPLAWQPAWPWGGLGTARCSTTPGQEPPGGDPVRTKFRNGNLRPPCRRPGLQLPKAGDQGHWVTWPGVPSGLTDTLPTLAGDCYLGENAAGHSLKIYTIACS